MAKWLLLLIVIDGPVGAPPLVLYILYILYILITQTYIHITYTHTQTT